MDFNELMNNDWFALGVAAVIFFGGVLLARPLVKLILDRVLKRLVNWSESDLDDRILEALRKPLYWLFVFISLNLAVEQLPYQDFELNFQLSDIYFVLYFGIVFVVIWQVVRAVFDWFAEEAVQREDIQIDQSMVPLIRRLLLGVLFIIGSITFLGYFDIDASGLIATLGIGSLAFALAAQDALSDSISGFMIMLDRPFRIGDRIEVQELGTWGDVVDIGLRSSRILTQDHRMVVIPNSIMAKSLVVNYAYPNSNYRVSSSVGVAYGVDLEVVRKVLIDAVKELPGISSKRKVDALFTSFGDSALMFEVRWWLDSYADTPIMFDRVNTAIYKALNKAEIPIPFPQQDVHHHLPEGLSEALAKMVNK